MWRPYVVRMPCVVSVVLLWQGQKGGQGLLDWVRAPTFFLVGFPNVLYLLSETIFAIRAMQVPLWCVRIGSWASDNK